MALEALQAGPAVTARSRLRVPGGKLHADRYVAAPEPHRTAPGDSTGLARPHRSNALGSYVRPGMRHGQGTDLTVEHDGVVLAGSLWTPKGAPRSAIVMHPGSGPSDRHNDVYFPSIRTLLLDAGHAVASFDKRGVGESSGSPARAGINQQAGDLLACVAVVGGSVPDVPVGVFGHSQGGWVVFEAAARGRHVSFAIANSGPAVSVVTQERFAVGSSSGPLADSFEALVTLAHEGADFDRARAFMESAGDDVARRFVGGIEDVEAWQLACLVLGHDPAVALGRIKVPLLALYGADDSVVPVEASVAELNRLVRPDLLNVAVLAGGDHRIQRDGVLVPGYASVLLAFVDAECAR